MINSVILNSQFCFKIFSTLNYLAHLYLSQHSNELLIGNFIADAVKGDAYKNYSEGISMGILMHRHIDTYTDNNTITEKSKAKLREKFRKFSGIIVDVYYDHFLAKKWGVYSNIALQNFANTVYDLVKKNRNILPEESKRFSEYMTQNNILFNYSKIEGIDKVFRGMASRSKFPSKMEEAAKFLEENYSDFENDFDDFFPQLIAFTNTYR